MIYLFLVLAAVLLVLWLVSLLLSFRSQRKRKAASLSLPRGTSLLTAFFIAIGGAVAFFVNPYGLLAVFAALLPQILLRGAGLFRQGGWFRREASSGEKSQVETEFLQMILDHDSGDFSGKVKKGAFAGRQLAEMSLENLLALLAECRRLDTRSADLLEAWLDRVHGNAWRGREEARSEQERQGPPEARLSRQEAAEILGVSEDASKEDVVRAYRRLIQRLHSDRGGSAYLASLVNLARDELLKGKPD